MSDSDNRNPTLAEVIDLFIDHALEGFLTSLFGYVTRYDPVKQVVDVQPYNKRRFMMGDGSIGVERLPVAQNCPVMFSGNKAGRLTYPIATGDTVLLTCLSSSISRWLTLGVEAEPENQRQNSLSDCVPFAGGQAWTGKAKAPTTAPTDAVVLHVGKHQGVTLPLKLVSVDADEIVAINSELAALTEKFNDLVARFNAHGHMDSFSAPTTRPSSALHAPAPVPSSASTSPDPAGSPRVLVPAPVMT